MKRIKTRNCLTALLVLLCLLLVSCASSNNSQETDRTSESTANNTTSQTEDIEDATSQESVEHSAEPTEDPTDDPSALESYTNYMNSQLIPLPHGFIPHKSLWFEYLGALVGFETNEATDTYSYTFTDKFGFRVKASVTPVVVDDIDVYRSMIAPYSDGRTVEGITYDNKIKMNELKGLDGKTVSLDRTHYIYDKNGELITIATVYEGNFIEYTPADYNEKGVSFSDYENDYGFISAFLDGYNAARVFTAGIYPKNAVSASNIDEFITEADKDDLYFTDSVKASELLKSGSFIPEGHEISSIMYEDSLDYEYYPMYLRYCNINLKGTDSESSMILSITYDKYGLDDDYFEYSSQTVIDEERGIISYEASNDRIFLTRDIADSVRFFLNVLDKESYNDDIKNTFTVFTDEVVSMIAADIPKDNEAPEKVTFSSYFELESLIKVVETTPDKIESYLESRGYAICGLDTAEEATELVEMARSVPLFNLNERCNLSYYPRSGELSVNFYVSGGIEADSFKHIQFRYMPAGAEELKKLTADLSMPKLNLENIQLTTCSYVDGKSYVGKWDDGKYGLIASETHSDGFGNSNFFNSVYSRSQASEAE